MGANSRSFFPRVGGNVTLRLSFRRALYLAGNRGGGRRALLPEELEVVFDLVGTCDSTVRFRRKRKAVVDMALSLLRRAN